MAITYITRLMIYGTANYQFAVVGDAYIQGPLKIGAYTLPTADGTAGQVLCTNGSGTVSWGVGGGGGSAYWTAGIGYISPCNNCNICTTGNLTIGGFGFFYAGFACITGNVSASSTNCLGIPSSPGAWKEVHAYCVLPSICMSSPITCGTSCVVSPAIKGSTCVCTAYLYSTGNVYAGGCLSSPRLNINASSACTFYVSGNGVYSGTLEVTYLDGTCVCGSRRLQIPVGTNCY